MCSRTTIGVGVVWREEVYQIDVCEALLSRQALSFRCRIDEVELNFSRRGTGKKG